MESLLPPSSQLFLTNDETQIRSDTRHIQCRVFQKYTRQQVQIMSMPLQLNTEHCQWLIVSLRNSYSEHYGKKNIYEFGSKQLKYWKKFTFVDKDSELRLGFTCGSYVAIIGREELGIMEQIVTHKLTDGLTYLFLLLKILQPVQQTDWLSNIPLFRSIPSKNYEVVGLPVISAKRPYIVNTNGIHVHNDVPPGKDVLWHFNWNINYG
jgi:hypothetical protein